MQENEFEKRLRQEMDEFKLRPSDNVWEKVEEELNKKKRRRVVFFIMMLAGLGLLGYSGYFVATSNSRDNIVQQEHNNIPASNQNQSLNTHPATPVEKIAVSPKSEDQTRAEKTSDKGNVKTNPVASTEISEQATNTTTVDRPAKPAKTRNNKQVTAITAKKSNHPAATTKDDQVGKAAIISSELLANDASVKGEVAQQESAKDIVPFDSQTINATGRDSVENKSDSTSEPKAGLTFDGTKKQNFFSKIKWSVDFSIGKSSVRNEAFSLFSTNKSADMLYNSPVNNSGGGLVVPVSPPSDFQSGPGVRAGLLGELKLSKRSSISSGIQYVYNSNTIMVGTYHDTMVMLNNSFSQASRVNAVYRGGYQKEYTNHYHFIQIPLQYQWQVNKGLKLPLVWHVGVSAGYLLSTNALLYDTTAGGIYYRDKAAFNKFRFNMLTGLSFRFGVKSKVKWSIGPELSMGMNKLMKDSYLANQYLFYGGVTGRIFFNKRNHK